VDVELVTVTQLPIKLSSSNYSTWYKQVTLLLTTNNVLDYISDILPCPYATIETGDATVENPTSFAESTRIIIGFWLSLVLVVLKRRL